VNNTLGRFVIAFLIGALIGLEREKANSEDGQSKATGLRTFILIALTGAVAAWMSTEMDTPWLFIGAAAVCALFLFAGYRAQLSVTPGAVGLTTEFAAFIIFLLGGVVLFGYPQLGVALAIATSAVLAFRRVLHRLVDRVGWDDIFAALKLLIVAFIVLPVVPREPVDPWGVLNPYVMTWLVILIAGLSFLGYLITRWLGPGRGTVITGLAGGLVSSTAVTLSLSRRSHDKGPVGATETLAAGILFSWVVMCLRIVTMCVVVNAALARELALPMGILALIAGAGGVYCQRAGVKVPAPAESLQLKNPFSLTFAIKFALFFTAVALLVNRAEALLSKSAVFAVAGLAGLTDVDAITLSMARGAYDASTAVVAIIIAAVANTLVKMGLVAWAGNRPLARRVLPATIGMVLGAAAYVVLRAP
jgi:uncharacterized membrane protein (DUF4010 family)